MNLYFISFAVMCAVAVVYVLVRMITGYLKLIELFSLILFIITGAVITGYLIQKEYRVDNVVTAVLRTQKLAREIMKFRYSVCNGAVLQGLSGNMTRLMMYFSLDCGYYINRSDLPVLNNKVKNLFWFKNGLMYFEFSGLDKDTMYEIADKLNNHFATDLQCYRKEKQLCECYTIKRHPVLICQVVVQ